MVANPGVDARPHRVRESPYGGRFRGDRVLRGQLGLPFGSRQNDGKVTAPLALAAPLRSQRLYQMTAPYQSGRRQSESIWRWRLGASRLHALEHRRLQASP